MDINEYNMVQLTWWSQWSQWSPHVSCTVHDANPVCLFSCTTVHPRRAQIVDRDWNASAAGFGRRSEIGIASLKAECKKCDSLSCNRRFLRSSYSILLLSWFCMTVYWVASARSKLSTEELPQMQFWQKLTKQIQRQVCVHALERGSVIRMLVFAVIFHEKRRHWCVVIDV